MIFIKKLIKICGVFAVFIAPSISYASVPTCPTAEQINNSSPDHKPCSGGAIGSGLGDWICYGGGPSIPDHNPRDAVIGSVKYFIDQYKMQGGYVGCFYTFAPDKKHSEWGVYLYLRTVKPYYNNP